MKKYDMAFSKAEQKERNSPKECSGPMMGSKYPYGLEISLDDATLEKLGIDSLPKVGKKIRIEATCEVVSVSQNQERDHKNRSVRLQIVSMGCESGPQSALEAVEDGVEDAS